MNTKLLITLRTISLLLFTACGSDSKDGGGGKSMTERLKEKEYLIIGYGIDKESCEVSSLKENIAGGQFGNLFTLENTIDKEALLSQFNNTNAIDCATFDRITGNKCRVYDLSESSGEITGTSCTVGFKTK